MLDAAVITDSIPKPKVDLRKCTASLQLQLASQPTSQGGLDSVSSSWTCAHACCSLICHAGADVAGSVFTVCEQRGQAVASPDISCSSLLCKHLAYHISAL